MADTFKIFLVEDDVWYGELLKYQLSMNPDYEVSLFESGKALLDSLYLQPSAISMDFSLPDIEGNELFDRIKKHDPDIPIIIISGQDDITTAIDLIKKGAFDYIVKDDHTKDRLWNAMLKAKEAGSLRQEISALRKEVGQKYEFSKTIIGESPILKNMFSRLEKAAKTKITVSITCETGTGKEVAAKAIHYNSALKNKPFVAVNVAAIPKDLIESELFGYEKGVFTGATARRIGKFEEAKGGTIFLDEIGEMDISLQAKLLRVLQEQEITRVGGNNTVKIDARIIVATHRNLAEEVKSGNFRKDLFYRLWGLPIDLPPLRDRGKDVLLLAQHFIKSFCKRNGMGSMKLTSAASQKLLKYAFPGNIRELKAVIELAAVMGDDGIIDADHISFAEIGETDELLSEEMTLKEYTTRIIQHFLDKYDRDVLLVAKKLNIGKSTIYNMLKEGSLSN